MKNTDSLKTAQDDLKTLEARLSDYKKYYDSLKAMMDKNTEAEKKHRDELRAIQQQRVDNHKLAADLIAKMTGADKNQTDQQHKKLKG